MTDPVKPDGPQSKIPVKCLPYVPDHERAVCLSDGAQLSLARERRQYLIEVIGWVMREWE